MENILYSITHKLLSLDNSNVLEIGCGAGGILQPFKENGCNVIGIDLGLHYLDYGKSKGLNLFQADADELLKDYEGKFDLIILSHVIEHFLDIKKEFDTIKKLLKNGGYLYIEVPGIKNMRGYGYDFLMYFQNAHTYHFSLDTLKQVVSQCELKFINGNENIISIFQKYHDTDIQNYFYDIKDYMFTVESARCNLLKV